VHKVAFNPHGGRLLLSASQDGTVLLWDLREAKSDVRIFRARNRYNGQSDGIRDVKWNPQDAMEFAIGTDNGVVQKWHFQNSNRPLLRINAHETQCTSVDWHPDGKHLVSASQDKHLKVWDVSSENKRLKPQWSIRTPYPISNARWRCSASDSGSSSIQCSQIATSYDRRYPIVHVWDFRRQYMPRHEICDWSTAPTDLLWASERLLWTVSREGHFNQIDLSYVPPVIDRRPMQAFAISPTGEICVFTQKRTRRRLSDVDDPRSPYVADRDHSESFSEKHEFNRNAADEPIDESLLSSSYKRHHARALSTRSTKSAASTPPSVTDPEIHRVVRLNETLSLRDHSAMRTQIAYRGPLDGAINTMTLSFLAQKYKIESLPLNPTINSYLNIGRIFDQNAVYAQRTGSYRIAQTWRVLGTIVSHELKQRATENKRQRLLKAAKPEPGVIRSPKETKTKMSSMQPLTTLQNPAIRAVQTGHTVSLGIESTSNVTTPQARPSTQPSVDQGSLSTISSLPNPDHDELSLPPSLVDQPSSAAIPALKRRQSESHNGPNVPVFDEHEWYLSASQINARKAQMSNWRAAPKVPIDFEMQASSPMNVNAPPRVMRHDSDDSFGMLSMSTESQHGDSQPGTQASFSASFTSGRSHRPSMSRIPEGNDAVDFRDIPIRPGRIPGLQKSNSSLSDFSRGQSWLTSSSEFDSDGRSLENVHRLTGESNMETSQTIIPDNTFAPKSLANISGPLNLTDHDFVLSDFESISSDTQSIGSITGITALLQVLSFYTSQVPNPQAIYHISTVLTSILGQGSTSGPKNDHAPSKTTALGIPLSHAESILALYQLQLQALQIYNPAVNLARAAYSSHPLLFDTANNQIGFVCQGCGKPINNPTTKMRCETCTKRQAPCPICWQKYPALSARKQSRKSRDVWSQSFSFSSSPEAKPKRATTGSTISPSSTFHHPPPSYPPTINQDTSSEPTPSLTTHATQSNLPVLWQSCLTCGHGAHAACLQAIHNNLMLGGKCPTDGCLCDCIPGTYRTHLNREAVAEAEAARAASEGGGKKGTVRRDGARVRESAAARAARGALLEGSSSATAAAAPGQGGRAEEKRVVFVD
jgi:WD repeat-containing protein 24